MSDAATITIRVGDRPVSMTVMSRKTGVNTQQFIAAGAKVNVPVTDPDQLVMFHLDDTKPSPVWTPEQHGDVVPERSNVFRGQD